MSKFFGTDGIRRAADDFTPEFLRAVVRGLVQYGEKVVGSNFKVLVGGDTRESSEWIIQDLCEALESLGVEYGSVGVLPTPAINYVFYEMGFDFAIDVTASHNPYTDNGIKIFERGSKSGEKLCEDGRDIIEAAIDEAKDYELVATSLREDLHDEAIEIYTDHLKEYVGEVDFGGLTIGMDCANGAMSVIASKIFEQLGAKVSVINADTNYGTGINDDCGSTHLEMLKNLVLQESLDFGVAFDGDGDRVLMVDGNGELVDGDQMIAILVEAMGLKAAAVTVMANQGLLAWAEKADIKLEITAVGDQNVAEAMRLYNIPIGGEQSGHVILPGEATGDGMLTALMITRVVAESGKNLAELAKVIQKFPQIILNMPATAEQKTALKNSDSAKKVLLEYDAKLKDVNGRLLVRPSGTENLIRVTMWGENEEDINTLGEELVDKLKEVL